MVFGELEGRAGLGIDIRDDLGWEGVCISIALGIS
jgi:hypothetical protein